MLQPSWWYFSSGHFAVAIFFREARVAQGWERSPPTNVARFRILASTSYVGWVCCWLSPLLLDFFLRVRRFYLPLKNQRFQIPTRSGTHGHVSTSSYELQSTPCVNKLHLQKLQCPTCLKSLFQSETKCKSIDMIFVSHANWTHFHKKGFAHSFWTQDWLKDRDVLTSLRGRSKKGNGRGRGRKTQFTSFSLPPQPLWTPVTRA